eukprot:3644173-Rhodomonas_salina.1
MSTGDSARCAVQFCRCSRCLLSDFAQLSADTPTVTCVPRGRAGPLSTALPDTHPNAAHRSLHIFLPDLRIH